jgi:hypothetical protein
VDTEAIEAGERVEVELDRIIERRAREAGDAQRVEEEWAESVRLYNGHRRETNREAWRCFYLAQAERLERTAAELAASHRARAAKLGEGAVS